MNRDQPPVPGGPGVQTGVGGPTIPPPAAGGSGLGPNNTVPITPIGYAGTSRDVELINGFDSILTKMSAVNTEISRTVRDIEALNERTQTYQMNAVARAGVGGVVSTSPRATSRAPTALEQGYAMSPSAMDDTRPTIPAPSGEVGGGGGQLAPYSPGELFDRARSIRGGGFSGSALAWQVMSLASRAGGRALMRGTQGLQGLESSLAYVPQGQSFKGATPDVNDKLTKQGGWVNFRSGALVNDEEQIQRFARARLTQSYIQNFGGALSEGEMIGPALARASQGARTTADEMGPQGASAMSTVADVTKVAAGFAVGGAIVDKGLHVAQNEREANAAYQRVLGGSNLEGMRARIGERAFGMGLTGRMGGQQAAQLYQGAMRLGARGAQAGAYQQFGVENYMRYGMDPDTSLQIMQAAAQGGQEELQGLSNSIGEVTKAARSAHIAADDLQKSFAQTFAAMTQITRAPGAPQGIATAVALTSAQWGQGFKNVNFSGQFEDPTQRHVMASLLHMPYNTFMGGIGQPTSATGGPNGGPTGTILAGQGQDAARNNIVRTLLPPAARQWIIARANQLGPTPSTGQLEQAGNDLLSSGTLGDATALTGILNSRGINITEGQLPQFLVEAFLQPDQYTKNATQAFNDTRARTGADAANVPSDVQPSRPRGLGAGTLSNLTSQQHAAGEVARVPGEIYSSAERGVKAIGRGIFGLKSKGDKMTDIKKTYQDQVSRTGVSSPIVEALIQQNDTSQRFKVLDQKNHERVVPLDEAIRDFYDQLISGDAVIMTGDKAGEKVSQETGVEGTSTEGLDTTGPLHAGAKTQAHAGEAASAWSAKNKAKGTAGVVRIEPSPYLRQMGLRFFGTGAAYVPPGFQGQPPEGPTNDTSTLPSG